MCRTKLTAVGDSTEIGKTAHAASEQSEEETPLNRQLEGLSKVIGIVTEGDTQMIVFDTPGLLNPRYALHRAMRGTALDALADADVIIYLADAADGPRPAPR